MERGVVAPCSFCESLRWEDADDHLDQAQGLFENYNLSELFDEQTYGSVPFAEVVHASDAADSMELKSAFARVPQNAGSMLWVGDCM